jgi:hypothetical protein
MGWEPSRFSTRRLLFLGKRGTDLWSTALTANALNRRRELRLLDLCLHRLEDAQERGESILSGRLATQVAEMVGPLVPGMAIVDAMEMVFSEQEHYLKGPHGPEDGGGGSAAAGGAGPAATPYSRIHEPQHGSLPSRERGRDREGSAMTDVHTPRGAGVVPVEGGVLAPQECGPISETEARALTDRIRTATRHVCLLLHEVHMRRAWVPLGYSSWEQYVQSEFSISRTRSYELLDQANVILDLRSAAGTNELPDVSAYVALQIKTRLPAIKETLRERIRQADGGNAVDIVAEIVDEHRRQVVQSRRLAQERRNRRSQADDPDDQEDLAEAIGRIAGMAAAGHVETLVDVIEAPQIESLESAIHWLTDLVEQWRRRHDQPLDSSRTRAGSRNGTHAGSRNGTRRG